MALGSCLFKEHYAFAQTDQIPTEIQAANTAVERAFTAVLDAEKAGANVTSLLKQLNVATDLLAQAENAYRTGDNNLAANRANAAVLIAQQVTSAAQTAQESASASAQTSFWSTIALTVIGTIVFVLALFWVWRRFKQRYINGLSEAKPEVTSQ